MPFVRLLRRVQLTMFLLQYGVALAFFGAGSVAVMVLQNVSTWLALTSWAIGTGAATAWLQIPAVYIRRKIVPLFIKRTRCPKRDCPSRTSGKYLSLYGIFGTTNYWDYKPRHVLDFLSNKGNEIGSFNCPHCKATILLRHIRGNVVHGFVGTLLEDVLKAPGDNQGSSGVLLGKDAIGQDVYVNENDFERHGWVLGKTGSGKSTMLGNTAKQVIERGGGLTVYDPNKDLVDDIEAIIPKHRKKDVVRLDVAKGNCGLGLLVANSDDEREAIADDLVDVFARLYSDWGTKMSEVFRMALLAVMEDGGTLKDVYYMIASDEKRKQTVKYLEPGHVRDYWEKEFADRSAKDTIALRDRLRPIVFHKVLGKVLCSERNDFDAWKNFRENKIVLVNLSGQGKAKHITTIIGSVLLTKETVAAFKQGQLDKADRAKRLAIADEAQRFVGRAAGVADILSEARKYGYTFIGANQYLGKLPPSVRQAIEGNIGFLAVFRIGKDDTVSLMDYFEGTKKNDFMTLPNGHCMVRFESDWKRVHALQPISWGKQSKKSQWPGLSLLRRQKRIEETKVEETKPEQPKPASKPLAWMN